MLLALGLELVEGRLCHVDVAGLDHGLHVAVEERKEQDADVRTVDIGIGHDDDLVVARLVDVELLVDSRTNGRDERGDGVAREGAVLLHALHVEDLATQGEHCLDGAVTRHLGRATCGVTLDDEELGHLGVAH